MSVEVGTKVWVRKGGGNDSDDWIAAEISRSVQDGSSLALTFRDDETHVEGTITVPRGEDVANDLKDVKIRNVDGQCAVCEGAAVGDLITLTHLHEPSIVFTLKARYDEGAIYTYTGPILIALNPFFRIPLYSEELVAAYQAEGQKKVADPEHRGSVLPPHAYAIADNAYSAMAHPNGAKDTSTSRSSVNQSILVSGESGAGKTETTKIVMQYLASVSKPQGDDSSGGGGGLKGGVSVSSSKEPLEKQVVESNPILEAFGNARTVRNDNSSRFGKFIEIQFDASAHLVGAQVRTFLLEKVRLVRQSEGERNFHIFYQLTAPASAAAAATVCSDHEERNDDGDDGALGGGGRDGHSVGASVPALKAPSEYLYLSQSGCFDRRDGVADGEEYAALRKAFQVMRFSDADVTGALTTAAGVLSLGEVEFEPHEDAETTGGFYAAMVQSSADEEGQGSEEEEDPAAVGARSSAKLLGVEVASLAHALTTRSIKVGFETFQKKLSPLEAEEARDGLAKFVYGALFEFVVSTVNETISATQTPHSFIGLLDIFGFESFKQNGFEQFLINYCNEVLQQQFNLFVFEAEQEEYAREQILWSFVSFPDNKLCIDMIEAKSLSMRQSLVTRQNSSGSSSSSSSGGGSSSGGCVGILSLLDEQTVFPNATDASFSSKLHDTVSLTYRQHFGTSPELRASSCFVVHHYAGSVRYDTKGFLERNRDKLYPEGAVLLQSSSSAFVQRLLELASLNDGSGGGGSPCNGCNGGGGQGGGGQGGKDRARQRRASIAVVSGSGGGCGGASSPSFARSCSGPVNAGAVSAAASAATAAAFGGGGQDGGARKRRVSIGGPTLNNVAGGCDGSPLSSSPLSGGSGKQQSVSTCTQFKDSLKELVAQISLTRPHYVRCLKPNDAHQPHSFDNKRVTEQLRCGGVLAAVQVSRAGFPVRMKHGEFVKRYGLLLKPKDLARALKAAVATAATATGEGQRHRMAAKAILDTKMVPALLSLSLSSSSSSSPVLEEAREAKAPSLQKKAKRGSLTRLFGGVGAAAAAAAADGADGAGGGDGSVADSTLSLSSSLSSPSSSLAGDEDSEEEWKVLLARVGLQLGTTKVFFRQQAFNAAEALRAKATASAVTLLQACLARGRGKRIQFLAVKRMVLWLQTLWRQRQALAFVARLRKAKAATKLCSCVRRVAARLKFVALRRGAVLLQALARGKPSRRQFVRQRRLKAAAVLLKVSRRFLVSLRKFRVALLVTLVAARWRGQVGRAQARKVKRESRAAGALRQQVAAFQVTMREAESLRVSCEGRAVGALALLASVEEEARALRAHCRLLEKMVVEKDAAQAEMAAELAALQASHEAAAEQEARKLSEEMTALLAAAEAAAATGEDAALSKERESGAKENEATIDANNSRNIGVISSSSSSLVEVEEALQRALQRAAAAEERTAEAVASAQEEVAAAEGRAREAVEAAAKQVEGLVEAAQAKAQEQSLKEEAEEKKAREEVKKVEKDKEKEAAEVEERTQRELFSSLLLSEYNASAEVANHQEGSSAAATVASTSLNDGDEDEEDEDDKDEDDDDKSRQKAHGEVGGTGAKTVATDEEEEEEEEKSHECKAMKWVQELPTAQTGESTRGKQRANLPEFRVGQRVDALYGGVVGNWFSGVIDQVVPTAAAAADGGGGGTDGGDDTDGGAGSGGAGSGGGGAGHGATSSTFEYTYVVSYDDGDCEAGVPETEIRVERHGREIDVTHNKSSSSSRENGVEDQERAFAAKLLRAQVEEARGQASVLEASLLTSTSELVEARVEAQGLGSRCLELESEVAASEEAKGDLLAANKALENKLASLELKLETAAKEERETGGGGGDQEDEATLHQQRLLREVEEEEEEEEENADDTLSQLTSASSSPSFATAVQAQTKSPPSFNRSARTSMDRVAQGLTHALQPLALPHERGEPATAFPGDGKSGDGGSSVGSSSGACSGPWASTHTSRGMPTAKCHICKRRIPLDAIDDHAEKCGTSVPTGMPFNTDSSSTGGGSGSSSGSSNSGLATTTKTSAPTEGKMLGVVVTVLPSSTAPDAFQVTVFEGHHDDEFDGDEGGLNEEGVAKAAKSSAGLAAAYVVERSASRIEALHRSLHRELGQRNGIKTSDSDSEDDDDDDDDGTGTASTSSTTSAASALSGAAAGAASLFGGFSNLAFGGAVAASSSSDGGAKGKEEGGERRRRRRESKRKKKEALGKKAATSGEDEEVARSGGLWQPLPTLPAALSESKERAVAASSPPDRGELCRSLERYFMLLLELNREWVIERGRGGAGGSAGGDDGNGSLGVYLEAHRLLMAFLDDSGKKQPQPPNWAQE